ncbi:MAG: hypothetical protein AB7O97_15310 [Planctomycetota bacterium]
MSAPRTQAHDTDPIAEQRQFEIWSRMSATEKFAAFAQLMAMADAFAEAGIRRLHPDADDREVFLRRAARTLDRATMIAAYGWDPAAHR